MGTELHAVRAELHDLLLHRAFTFGDFTLSSGRKSTYYFDGRQVTLDGRGAWLVSQMVLARCRAIDAQAIGGLTLGADPIVAGVATLSGNTSSPLQAFIVRKEAKTHGTGSRIAGPALQPGTRVALVDDTATTGNSYIQAADALKGTGVQILEAIVIVDREEGAREALGERGISLHALFTRREFPESI